MPHSIPNSVTLKLVQDSGCQLGSEKHPLKSHYHLSLVFFFSLHELSGPSEPQFFPLEHVDGRQAGPAFEVTLIFSNEVS